MLFDGRDLFAPAAARLLLGCSFESLGESGELHSTFRPPAAVRVGSSIYGRIIYIDAFGALVTDIPYTLRGTIVIAGRRIPHVPNYEALRQGGVGWLNGSGGTIELSLYRARADRYLGIAPGCPVKLDECC